MGPLSCFRELFKKTSTSQAKLSLEITLEQKFYRVAASIRLVVRKRYTFRYCYRDEAFQRCDQSEPQVTEFDAYQVATRFLSLRRQAHALKSSKKAVIERYVP